MNEGDEEQRLVVRAASGDASAQLGLADVAFSHARSGALTLEEALHAAEFPCRMAASHGGENERLYLAGFLLVRAQSSRDAGNSERSAVFVQEAQTVLAGLSDDGCADASVGLATLLDQLANEGDEDAASSLSALSNILPSAVLQRASAFSRALHQIASCKGSND